MIKTDIKENGLFLWTCSLMNPINRHSYQITLVSLDIISGLPCKGRFFTTKLISDLGAIEHTLFLQKGH